jgi:glycerol-3-phosphate acyltransferase PlsY
MELLWCILIGYGVGCINPAYIIGQIRGFDIRKKGSGNAGASNALIVLGKLLGVFCALFDIGKAVCAVLLARYLFSDFTYCFAVTATACILGHIFPFYMKFRGGKGLACLAGVVLAFDWRVFIPFAIAEIAFALIVNYICVIPTSAAVIFPLVYAIMTHDVLDAALLLATGSVIIIRHKDNFIRIKNGTELRLSFIWSKNKEIERVKGNVGSTGDADSE